MIPYCCVSGISIHFFRLVSLSVVVKVVWLVCFLILFVFNVFFLILMSSWRSTTVILFHTKLEPQFKFILLTTCEEEVPVDDISRLVLSENLNDLSDYNSTNEKD